MKKTLLLIIIALAAALGIQAQTRPERQAMSDEERERWLVELRNVKHDFLARELQLTQEQQQAFFPDYDEMDDAINAIAAEARNAEAALGDVASDDDVIAVAQLLFEQKGREAAIETQYFEKFKQTLTPRQLLRLKNAERKFTQQLVRQHKGGRQRP